jgi:hypothetical protein
MRKRTLYAVVGGLALLVLLVLLVPVPAQGQPAGAVLPQQAAGRVLLVDDDWDYQFTHPESRGGRPYYTSTLEAVGLTYDVWDVWTQGEPDYALVSGYEAVVWFTGYAYEEPGWWPPVLTPENEAVLGEYLDNGGRLILSAQNYENVTAFMQSYLDIDWINEDMTITTTIGVDGTPIGNGLGPYTLVRPDAYGVYWPEGALYEGPYDDEVYSLTPGSEPFRYDVPGNANPNSTSYDGGTFKTVYLAWPFEWIGPLKDRARILSAMLDWMGIERHRLYLPIVVHN